MRSSYRSRFANIGLALGAALVAAGCQSRPTANPQPQPAATSLFVRNFTGREVAVYAVPKNDAKPVWLTNVPVDASRTVLVRWSDLQANGGLVVRTQIVGSSRTWTSDPLVIDEDIVGVLDYNIRPRVAGRGSAIFFHIAKDDLAPTAGCVALRPRDMERLLPRLARRVTLLLA